MRERDGHGGGNEKWQEELSEETELTIDIGGGLWSMVLWWFPGELHLKKRMYLGLILQINQKPV